MEVVCKVPKVAFLAMEKCSKVAYYLGESSKVAPSNEGDFSVAPTHSPGNGGVT